MRDHSNKNYGLFLAGHIPATCRRLLRATACRVSEEVSFLTRPRPKTQSAIIVAGAERSGTTWLASLIASVTNAQQIIEPFSPEAAAPISTLMRSPGVQNHQRNSLSRRYLDRTSQDAKAARAIYLTLTGRNRSVWTDVLADQFSPHRYLIKAVHANMSLGFMHERFQPSIVFLRRNPLAVVASRQRGFGGRFRDAMLPRMLAQSSLRNRFPQSMVYEMLAEKSWLARHAIEWAIEDSIVSESFSAGQIHFVDYETLVEQPQEEFARVCKFLQQADSLATDFDRPTHTSVMRYDNAKDRVDRWRSQLSTFEQRLIKQWLDRIAHS